MTEKDHKEIALVVEQTAQLWTCVRRAGFMQEVRRIMRHQGLTHEDLALRMGMHRISVTRMLRGNQNVAIDTMYRIADALEMPLTITFGKP